MRTGRELAPARAASIVPAGTTCCKLEGLLLFCKQRFCWAPRMRTGRELAPARAQPQPCQPVPHVCKLEEPLLVCKPSTRKVKEQDLVQMRRGPVLQGAPSEGPASHLPPASRHPGDRGAGPEVGWVSRRDR